jgi:hypothetical protein
VEQTSQVDKVERTSVEQAAIFCDALRGALIAWIPLIEGQEGLPAMTRAMLVEVLRDLAGDFEKAARGDLLGEGKQG